MKYNFKQSVLVALRLGLGFIFAWAFLDKTFGLGLATLPAKAWLAGGSPTAGYLSHTDGVFSNLFQTLTTSAAVEWLFMLGLLGIGLALLLGIGLRVAAAAGSLLMILLWLSQLPLANNPFMDEHIIYALLIIFLASVNAGQWLGLGKWWSKLNLVKNNPWLK